MYSVPSVVAKRSVSTRGFLTHARTRACSSPLSLLIFGFDFCILSVSQDSTSIPLKSQQTDLATRGNFYTMMVPSRKKGRYIVKSQDGQVEEIFVMVDDARLPVEESEEALRLSKFD